MKFLRTVSTRRLLATIAGLVAAIAAGTAIAVAASGTGQVPPAAPLAQAVHQALAAPAIDGISARITFTNHLIDASNIQGSDPILSGASGRLWLSGNHQLRLELQGANGDAQAVVNNGAFWVYDPTSNTVYEGTLPAQTGSKDTGKSNGTIPSLAQIQSELTHLAQNVDLSGALPGNVGGQEAYTIQVSPKHDGGLLGSAQLAWDALHGVPLRVAVYARGDTSPVLELKATDVSYGAVKASVFELAPPPGAKVVKVSSSGSSAGAHGASDRNDKRHERASHAHVSGVKAVASHVPFTLSAPSSLVGLPRQSVTLLDWGGSPAALVSYGQNLGGIAVIEQAASTASAPSSSNSGDHTGLNLPTVSIHGATGQELDTALGTLVRFTRGGVSYTVVGSVPPTAADAAARAL